MNTNTHKSSFEILISDVNDAVQVLRANGAYKINIQCAVAIETIEERIKDLNKVNEYKNELSEVLAIFK